MQLSVVEIVKTTIAATYLLDIGLPTAYVNFSLEIVNNLGITRKE